VLPKEALAHPDTASVTEAADGSLRLSPTKAEIFERVFGAPCVSWFKSLRSLFFAVKASVQVPPFDTRTQGRDAALLRRHRPRRAGGFECSRVFPPLPLRR